ncbi:GlxA family transcriptional regulator [Zhihengliuella sp. ISTPL4]|uniref:GlxA family transcriptional regulator n=1 Tax=Zhihengliuella sp. ISTPL4 TaxID=2058657 RepID=UPI000C7C8992|nr:helix-turn-helix domain-containing protein [Zhihengliuella sp. ISTPL4]
MRIAIYAFDGVTMFHLAVPQMVFDEVTRQGLDQWDPVLFSATGDAVVTAEGYGVAGLAGPSVAETADLVVVPSWHSDGRPADAEIVGLLQSSHRRGAAVAGLCLGAIPVADAGLLAGRAAVTHWQGFDLLASRHSDIRVDQTVLYIDHGDVLTSAGTASALDACLHVVRSRLGSAAANQVARHLVIAPHRDGGQAQYIERPLSRPDHEPIAAVLDWALRNLNEDLSVERLATQAHMSRRSFVRAFRVSTGATPAAWVRLRRLDEARRLLEVTDFSVDQIASECGFGSPTTFRQRFVDAYRVSPSQYRRRFGDPADSPGR